MADYGGSDKSGNGPGSTQRTRGYQATRRQDRDRREKLYERLENTSSNNDVPSSKDETSSSNTPGKSELKEASNFLGGYQDQYVAKPAESSKYKSEASRSSGKDSSGRHGGYQSRQDYHDQKDKDYRDRRSYDYKDSRKDRYDRYSDRHQGGRYEKSDRYDNRSEKGRGDKDSKDRRNTGGGDSAREFKFKDKADAGKNNKKPTEDQTKSDANNLMSLLTSSKEATPSSSKESTKEAAVSASDLEAQWQKEEAVKKRREQVERKKTDDEQRKEEKERKEREEEERKQEEEERKRREEEEKRAQEEAEAQRVIEEEKANFEAFIKECEDRLTLKRECRRLNAGAAESRPDDSTFTKLDSNLKKCTAFVKRLRTLTESQEEALMKDIKSLNLSKYIGEVAAAFTEAKLKMSDIPTTLRLCSVLHQRYADFSGSLLEHWQKVLHSKKDDKVSNPSKLRVDLRFFADLITIAVFTEKEAMAVLSNQLVFLIKQDMKEHNNLAILISFCKHCGDDYAGLIPTKFRELAAKYNIDIPRSNFLKHERQQACQKLLKEYHASLYRRLPDVNKELQALERTNHNILMTKGELSEERRQAQEAAQQAFTKLLTNAATYADLVNEGMPELPHLQLKNDDLMGINVFSPGEQHVYDGDSALFEDEDTRQFYEQLPGLKAMVPQILYKDSEAAATGAGGGAGEGAAEGEGAAGEGVSVEAAQDLNVEELERELSEQAATVEETPEEENPTEVQEEEDFDIVGSMKLILEEFISNLPKCVSRELIDKAASDFCMNLNTKANRKKLARALFSVQRTRYDLLPFYSRLVATLHPCMTDVNNELVQSLQSEFRWHVRKKDQINIESKLKVVRFIGELVKFKMFPKTEALHCIKMLLYDFKHHHIEMACALLDTCGRFLYRSPESHHMTKVFLEVMVRKKTALHLDGRYTTMIENTFYYCNPPENRGGGWEDLPPLPPIQQYVHRLLYRDLNKITCEKILRQLRKLDWDDKELSDQVTKCLVSVWKVRYNVIHCLANLLAGLAPYHEDVAISVIDGVLEDIRMGLEQNHPKFNQRRISCVKYLGELYNYRMVESSVIFKMLYSFITFGVFYQDDIVSVLDPPEHLLRIRLVCSLLDTCGQYFDRGSSKKKLDCFIVYFQRYYWLKRQDPRWGPDCPFPVEVEYSYLDTVQMLRPKLPLCADYQAACEAVATLEKQFITILAELMPDQQGESGEAGDQSLAPIQEGEETDDMSQDLSHLQLTDPSGDQRNADSLSGALGGSGGGGDSQTGQSRGEGGSQASQGRTGDSQSQEERGRGPRMSVGEEEGEEEDEEEEGRTQQSEDTQSQSQSQKEHDDDETDSDSDASRDSDEADDVIISGGPVHIACPEDEDFMAAFDKMLSDSVSARSGESVKTPQVDIPMPVQGRGQKPRYALPGEELSEETPIKFMLMMRRGNKQHLASLDVPVSDKLAATYRQREQAERDEKEKMKRRVLDIHERQEEEDYQEMLDSLSRPGGVSSGIGNPNLCKERRVRYQHPKGAPDADQIFGSKSVKR